MSSKRCTQKNMGINKGAKYLENADIEDYVSEDKVMRLCLEKIITILRREGCKEKNLKFTCEVALDLDKVEIENRKGTSNRDNTVDFVIGLGNKQLLLVEAKFDAKNMENVASDIPKKVKHSREILTCNPKFVSFYNKSLILLNSEKFEQNKRKLLTLLNNQTSYAPMKVNEFYTTFFEN